MNYNVDNSGNARDPRRGIPIPDDLAVMNVGPSLAASLDDIEVGRVSGHDTVEVMVAAYRQAAYHRAVFLRALLETGMRHAGSGDEVVRCTTPGEFAPEEARAALLWTRRRADSTFAFAWDVFERLPVLGEAMLNGDLDEPRAHVFVSWTTGLTDDQAETICVNLLGRAASMTTGELAAAVKRAAIEIDPDWAERRYRAGINDRRVVGSHNPDGTANVSGQNLPVDRAVAACARVADIAKTAKASGDRRPIDHIRADIYLGLLDGTFTGMADHEIADWVRRHPLADPETDESNDRAASNGGSDHNTSDFSGNARDNSGRGDPRGGGADGSRTSRSRTENDSRAGSRTSNDGCGDATDGRGHTDGGGDHDSGGGRGSSSSDSSGGGGGGGGPNNAAGGNTGAAARRAVRELRLDLTSALGDSERAAEIPGWGVIPAAVARQIVHEMVAAEWRYAICDPCGRLLLAGITRHRPSGASIRGPDFHPVVGGIVELHVTVDDLHRLVRDIAPGAEWAEVVNDLHRAYANLMAGESNSAAPASSGAPAGGNDCDPSRRLPTAALRRLVQIRDRVCVFPGCRMPAVDTDQDHRHEHARGGPTVERNLQSLCRFHHRLKGEGGWEVDDEPDGFITWQSPLGVRYRVRPPPVMIINPQWYRPPPGRHGR